MEAVFGLVIGFLAAVTGLMLGSLRLPVLIRLLRVDPRVAVGTNMAIGCLTAMAGACALSLGAGHFDLLTLLIVAPPTVLGGYLGSRWTGRFRKESLQALVGVTIALTGLGMAIEGSYRALLA